LDGDVKYELQGQHFVWDSVKYNTNKNKHGVTFEEAATVLISTQTEYFNDDEHSDYEERIIAIGISNQLRVLMVCHCMRENESVIRIISARKATKEERLLWTR